MTLETAISTNQTNEMRAKDLKTGTGLHSLRYRATQSTNDSGSSLVRDFTNLVPREARLTCQRVAGIHGPICMALSLGRLRPNFSQSPAIRSPSACAGRGDRERRDCMISRPARDHPCRRWHPGAEVPVISGPSCFLKPRRPKAAVWMTAAWASPPSAPQDRLGYGFESDPLAVAKPIPAGSLVRLRTDPGRTGTTKPGGARERGDYQV